LRRRAEDGYRVSDIGSRISGVGERKTEDREGEKNFVFPGGIYALPESNET
jgi:hypothetical protein